MPALCGNADQKRIAIGEPSQALAVVTSVALIRLQDTAAAYRAIALARLGQMTEAVAVPPIPRVEAENHRSQ